MIQAAKTIQDDLKADTALQAVLLGRSYWELAPDNYALPVITFTVIEDAAVSKDRNAYRSVVRCFGETLTSAAQLAELAKTALKNAHHKYKGGQSGYTDTEKREGYVELNFNFNI